MKNLEGKKIICKECNNEFILTKSEEEFYKSLNYDMPKRCYPCRQKRKTVKND